MSRLKTTSFRDSKMKSEAEFALDDAIRARTESGKLVELADDKFVQLSNFGIGRAPARMIGDGVTRRKRANKSTAMADAWRDRFAKARQFVNELSALECTKINPIGDERHSGPSLATRAGGLDDRQSLFCRLNIEARRRARGQDQISKRYRCAQGAVAWGGVDDDKISRNVLNQPNPVGDAPARQRDFIDWEVEVSRLGPSARRSLLVAVDKSDVHPAPFCFARKAHRDRGFTDAAFALRHDEFCRRPACVVLSNLRVASQISRSTKDMGHLISELHRQNTFTITPARGRSIGLTKVHHRPAADTGDR